MGDYVNSQAILRYIAQNTTVDVEAIRQELSKKYGYRSTTPPVATRWRDQTIIALLEKLNRHRELDQDERVLMERAIRRLTPKREVWRWSEKEDRLLKALIRKRARIGGPRPFERNDDVRKIAEELGRTYWAVHRRIERLRKAMNCSGAKRKARG